MKNIINVPSVRIFGIITFIVVIGFSMTFIGCPDVNSNDNFAGTWLGELISGGSQYDIKIIAKDGNFILYAIVSSNDVEMMKGTYTVSKDTVTLKIVDINIDMFTYSNYQSTWVTFNQLNAGDKEIFGGSDTHALVISNNTLNVPFVGTLTKQP